ncbi:MAG: tetratricopeptide repeat protein, partial [Candidatus Omnitrophica bacterium]|nr:tetratricopeptide repeat protein [Candidatus Omnitrophota bacterium]
KAKKYFLELSKSQADNELKDDALFWLGLCYIKLKDFDAALRQMKLLQKEYPQSAFVQDSFLKIAEIYIQAGRKAKAREEFKEITVKFPDSIYAGIAFERLAQLAAAEGDFERAIIYINDALKVKGAVKEFKAQLESELAHFYVKTGKPNEAVDEYFKLIYLYPEDKALTANSYISMAEIFIQTGDYKRAQKTYEKIMEGKFDETEEIREKLLWLKEKLSIRQ